MTDKEKAMLDDPSCDASDKSLYDDCYDDMDGDHESGFASAGFGVDEDYGYFGDEEF